MRFGTWNVRGLYRAGSLETLAIKLEKFKLYLLAVQEIRWIEAFNQQTKHFLMEMGS
jgi:exonuclease III